MLKVWQQLRREGIDVVRCAEERLIRRLGIRGVVRVKRDFTATRPNQLWVADFKYIAT
ncbi:hypothetical protein H1S06_00570 [Marinobacterium sp. 3-1745]|uniref:Transposase n=1 Tax=Marinobacterium marinum TaxID=2756129 RepID=A0A7W2AAD3_9GAMM|nr:hypothetical protein [Marinobacterium marinum]